MDFNPNRSHAHHISQSHHEHDAHQLARVLHLQPNRGLQRAPYGYAFGRTELNWKMAATRPDDASPTATLAGTTGGARAARD